MASKKKTNIKIFTAWQEEKKNAKLNKDATSDSNEKIKLV